MPVIRAATDAVRGDEPADRGARRQVRRARGPAAHVGRPERHLPEVGELTDQARLLVVGQGAFEVHPTKSLPGAHQLADLLAQKDIPHELDVWGFDSAHDWPWWRKQLAHHLPRFC